MVTKNGQVNFNELVKSPI